MAHATPIAPTTEVVICTTCRPPGASRNEPAAGELLLDTVQVAQLQDDEGHHAQVLVRGPGAMTRGDYRREGQHVLRAVERRELPELGSTAALA